MRVCFFIAPVAPDGLSEQFFLPFHIQHVIPDLECQSGFPADLFHAQDIILSGSRQLRADH